MLYTYLVSFLLFAGITSALPASLAERTSCQSFVDNFDDLPSVAGVVGQVGTYHGVTYQAFVVGVKSPITGTTGGIIPHSGNQDAVNGLRNTITQIGAITLVPFGNIVASPSKSFDLNSFYFGCGTNGQQPLASTSTACTISVTGFDTAGKQIGVATFSFAPQSLLAAPMNFAILPLRFKSLKNVTIGLSSTVTNPAAAALWIDDVSHCNYS